MKTSVKLCSVENEKKAKRASELKFCGEMNETKKYYVRVNVMDYAKMKAGREVDRTG